MRSNWYFCCFILNLSRQRTQTCYCIYEIKLYNRLRVILVLVTSVWCVLLLNSCRHLVWIEWSVAALLLLLIWGWIAIAAASTKAIILIETTAEAILLLSYWPTIPKTNECNSIEISNIICSRKSGTYQLWMSIMPIEKKWMNLDIPPDDPNPPVCGAPYWLLGVPNEPTVKKGLITILFH